MTFGASVQGHALVEVAKSTEIFEVYDSSARMSVHRGIPRRVEFVSLA